jgi:stress response protein SCP2
LAILINSFNGAGFGAVETATVSMMQGPVKLHEVFIGGKKDANAICAAMMYRKNGVWSVMSSQDTGPGKVFTECEDLIK